MDPTASERPLLVYDGDCSFCRLWIDRWRELTGDRVRYAPFQEVAGQFPEIPREAFARAVQLILPDGKSFSAAHAVFRTLAFVPGCAWMLWLYQRLPGVAFVAEFFYRFVARHRNPLYRLTRLFWGRHFERPSFSLASWLFLRLLGFVYFFAFLSLATQILGLMGQNGILPATEFLAMLESRVGSERYWFFPTLAWLNSSDTALQVMSVGGVIGSLLLIFDIAPILVLSLLWILYLSLVTVGQDFLVLSMGQPSAGGRLSGHLYGSLASLAARTAENLAAQGPPVAAVVPALSADVFLRRGQACKRRSHLAQPDGAGIPLLHAAAAHPHRLVRSPCAGLGSSTARRRSCSSSNWPFPF